MRETNGQRMVSWRDGQLVVDAQHEILPEGGMRKNVFPSLLMEMGNAFIKQCMADVDITLMIRRQNRDTHAFWTAAAKKQEEAIKKLPPPEKV